MNVTQHYLDTLTLMDTASRARYVTVNATIMMEDTIAHAVKDILHHLLAQTFGNVTVSVTKPRIQLIMLLEMIGLVLKPELSKREFKFNRG